MCGLPIAWRTGIMSGTIIQHRFLREDARVAMDTMLGHEQSKAVHLTPRRMGGLESGQIGDVRGRHGRTGDVLKNPSTTVDAESRELAARVSVSSDAAPLPCRQNFHIL